MFDFLQNLSRPFVTLVRHGMETFKFITYHGRIYDLIDGPIRKSCQKFVHSFVNNECHEKYDTIDDGKNDRDGKSRLFFIQLKISTCPRNVHEQKVAMKEGFV